MQKSQKAQGWHHRRLLALKGSPWISTNRLLPSPLLIALPPCPSRLCLNRLLQPAKAESGLNPRQVSFFSHFNSIRLLLSISQAPRLRSRVPRNFSSPCLSRPPALLATRRRRAMNQAPPIRPGSPCWSRNRLRRIICSGTYFVG
jgi:hypothetical protein